MASRPLGEVSALSLGYRLCRHRPAADSLERGLKSYYENEMQIFYQDDVREVLPLLPEHSVDMCITSPPYYGLRKYDGEPVIWDSVDGCQHEWEDAVIATQSGGGWAKSDAQNYKKDFALGKVSQGNFCRLCGAWRGQLGLEPTPELYIKHLCDIFDLTKRVLKKTGTLWVNIDDSYAANRSYQIDGTKQVDGSQPNIKQPQASDMGIPAKSLIGIPERFVLEMLNRGWIRRSTIIWHKGNPMPESVKDRFTSDFEYLYLFSQQQHYYFEQQFEAVQSSTIERYKYLNDGGNQKLSYGEDETHKINRINPIIEQPGHKDAMIEQGRNKRCVWTINTKSYSGAHFATFPPELVRTPILAGCPEGGTVLDIFAGSGTTLQVALSLGRKSIGIDQSVQYCKLATNRPAQLGMGG